MQLEDATKAAALAKACSHGAVDCKKAKLLSEFFSSQARAILEPRANPNPNPSPNPDPHPNPSPNPNPDPDPSPSPNPNPNPNPSPSPSAHQASAILEQRAKRAAAGGPSKPGGPAAESATHAKRPREEVAEAEVERGCVLAFDGVGAEASRDAIKALQP